MNPVVLVPHSSDPGRRALAAQVAAMTLLLVAGIMACAVGSWGINAALRASIYPNAQFVSNDGVRLWSRCSDANRYRSNRYFCYWQASSTSRFATDDDFVRVLFWYQGRVWTTRLGDYRVRFGVYVPSFEDGQPIRYTVTTVLTVTAGHSP
jgi:hypothetical protein